MGWIQVEQGVQPTDLPDSENPSFIYLSDTSVSTLNAAYN